MFSLDTGEILAGAAALVFPFWPLLMVMPLSGSGRGRKRLPNAAQFLVVWVFLLVIRILLAFSTMPIASFLIPEPFSTTLFLLVGAFLVAFVALPWFKPRRRVQQTGEVAEADDLLHLSPRQFEEAVVELYTTLGHYARRTGATGDHGVDVVVNAKNGEKWVVQCKRWRGNVGEPVVRDFYGVVHHEKADKGTLITSGGFTAQARQWAKGKPLTLVDGEQFVKYLRRASEMESQPDKWQRW